MSSSQEDNTVTALFRWLDIAFQQKRAITVTLVVLGILHFALLLFIFRSLVFSMDIWLVYQSYGPTSAEIAPTTNAARQEIFMRALPSFSLSAMFSIMYGVQFLKEVAVTKALARRQLLKSIVALAWLV